MRPPDPQPTEHVHWISPLPLPLLSLFSPPPSLFSFLPLSLLPLSPLSLLPSPSPLSFLPLSLSSLSSPPLSSLSPLSLLLPPSLSLSPLFFSSLPPSFSRLSSLSEMLHCTYGSSLFFLFTSSLFSLFLHSSPPLS